MRRWLPAVTAAVMFSLCALVQLNDPDPTRWFMLYMAAALLAGAAPLHHPLLRRASQVLTMIAVSWGGWMLGTGMPDFDPNLLVTDPAMKTPGIELWREALGLLLIAGYHAWLGWKPRP